MLNFTNGALTPPSVQNQQLNIANPATGTQKLVDIDDERKMYAPFFTKQQANLIYLFRLQRRPHGQAHLQRGCW